MGHALCELVERALFPARAKGNGKRLARPAPSARRAERSAGAR